MGEYLDYYENKTIDWESFELINFKKYKENGIVKIKEVPKTEWKWKQKLKLVFEKYNQYKYLGGFDENKLGESKIQIKHNICNTKFEVKLRRIDEHGIFCHGCGYEIEPYIIRYKFYNLTNKQFYLIKKYNCSDKGLFFHKNCGKYFEKELIVFKKSPKCPRCSLYKSKGEMRINEVLNQENVKFEEQVTFDGCEDKSKLFFDFAVYNKDKISFLIEYQGKQHYMEVNHWEGEQGLKNRQKRDMIKKEYCKRNNIKLIEIIYWEYELIEEKIKLLLNQNENSKEINKNKEDFIISDYDLIDKLYHMCDKLILGSDIEFKSIWDKSLKMIERSNLSTREYIENNLEFDLKKELIKFEGRLFSDFS